MKLVKSDVLNASTVTFRVIKVRINAGVQMNLSEASEEIMGNLKELSLDGLQR